MNQGFENSLTNDVQIAEKSIEKNVSSAINELTKHVESLSSNEEKIRAFLDFMKAALSDKTPRFKDYWDAKRGCLPLFKGSLKGTARSQLWAEYIELSTEARHLKTVLDEQSAFAVEQIDLAIQAIETDLEKMGEFLNQGPEIKLSVGSSSLMKKQELYTTLQKELGLLSTLAVRVTSLRKEVINTEMRIRFKNKLFDRLSLAGDRIFPRRKELIQKISSEFLSDVMEFSKQFNDDNLLRRSGFEMREEIKDLQQQAKELTLDTQTFNQTRLELSRLWEILREKDKERKKEFSEKQEAYQKNVALVMDKIKPFAERCQAETFTPEEAAKQAGEILNFMKTIELGRDEVRYLKDEVSKARAPINERLAKQQEAREKEIEVSQKQRLEKVEQFKQRIKEMAGQVAETAVEDLFKAKEKMQHELFQMVSLSHAERELLEHEIKTFRDLIIDKKEKAIATMAPEQKKSLDHLYQVLDEWKEQKNEIRNQLEIYRKALAGSGFDFEKAMRYRELMDSEKNRLDKVNATIEELENQIDKLEEF